MSSSEWENSWIEWYNNIISNTENIYHDKYAIALDYLLDKLRKQTSDKIYYPSNACFYSRYKNICTTYENSVIKIEKSCESQIDEDTFYIRFTLQRGNRRSLEWEEIQLYVYNNDNIERNVYHNEKYYVIEKESNWSSMF
jgi:hypothetical protein